MAAVFFFSSLSHLGLAARVPDWISHPVEYAIGAALVCRALAGGRRPLTLSAALTATLLTTVYGITDEYHQSFVPGRTSDPADVGKDLAGSAAAASFLYRRWTMAGVAADSQASPRPASPP
jgi:VanZ family protein